LEKKMIFTEAEAVEKLCPLARNENCVASNCACWRWVPNTGERHFYVAKNQTAIEEKDAGPKPDQCADWEFFPYQWGHSAGWLEPTKEARLRRRGYCGLAGKPELG
jgi:hypothetical protein